MSNPTWQLSLDLSHQSALRREDLIESPANAVAISMIDAWPEWPGKVTVLAGPVGSGKSHIAGVWAELAGAEIVSCSKLSEEIDGLISHSESGGNVLVEDAGHSVLDQDKLFHLLNSIRQGGGFCMITSRAWPVEWRVTLKDLTSRLKAAQLVELQEPDDMLLRLVMLKLFSDRQVMVDEKVLDYCVVRMERSLGAAAKLVAAIDAEALARKSPVTRMTASTALEKLQML